MKEWKNRLRARLLATAVMTLLAIVCVAAQVQRQGASPPLTIQKQGSFAVGGKILGEPERTIAALRSRLRRTTRFR